MASIRKRTWTSAAGRERTSWLVDYRDQGGKRRSKQFTRKKDAEAWLTTTAADVQRGMHTPDSVSITVSEAAHLWLESVRMSDREPTTIASYDQHIRLHISPRCGGQKLSQLTAPLVRTHLDHWLSTLSRPMAVRVFRSFKAILNDAQERGFVAQNVSSAVRVRKAPRKRDRVVPPTKSELLAILATAQASSDLKSRAIVELLIFTGIRASELRGLAWSSINFAKMEVSVERRADRMGVLGPPKSVAGYRTIPLPSRVLATLREWKVACPPHTHNLVFPSERGSVLSHDVMAKKHLKPILEAAGVIKPIAEGTEITAKYTAHCFRHAAASMWIEQGMNPKRVQMLVGHGSIQVTFDTYGHLFEDADRGADDAQAIERALYGEK